MVVQPPAEGAVEGGVRWREREKANAVHLPRRLRLGGERHGESTGQRGQQEAAAVHAGMVGRMGGNVNGGAGFGLASTTGLAGGHRFIANQVLLGQQLSDANVIRSARAFGSPGVDTTGA